MIFETPYDFFTALEGPPQHDAHVVKYRGHLWLEHKRKEYSLRSTIVSQFVTEYINRHNAQGITQ